MPSAAPVSSERLAELLMSAAEQLCAAGSAPAGLVPLGTPVQRGRVHLGRHRARLVSGDAMTAVVGFSTAVWLGAADAAPRLDGLHYRAHVSVDARGRAVLDRRVRSWLAVADPQRFDVVAVVDEHGEGVWMVPVEDFGRRWATIAGGRQ